MNKAFGIVIFAVGAVAGSAATWYFTKTKYEKIAQEEIDSVKEVFSNRNKSADEKKDGVACEKKEEKSVSLQEQKKDRFVIRWRIMELAFQKRSKVAFLSGFIE